MKKYFLILAILMLCLTFVGNTTCSPATIIYDEQTKDIVITQFLDYYNAHNYDDAYNILNSCDVDAIYDILHDEIQDTLSHYRDKIIILSKSYAMQGDVEKAMSILVENLKFFADDREINSMLSGYKSEIESKTLVPYDGTIYSLTIKPLLAFPEYALTTKNPNYVELDKNYLTPNEFKNLLDELYTSDFVLCDTDILSSTPRLPEGKRPIILVFDNVCYSNDYKCQIDRLILNSSDQIATYTGKKTIRDRISLDNEFVPIMEQYLSIHPDFSLNNARGIITLSGSAGILGYSTQKTNANHKYEIKKVTGVVTKLKELGWEFGSCGYSAKETLQSEMDTQKSIYNFENEVENIVGDCKSYLTSKNISDNSEIFSIISDNYDVVILKSDEFGNKSGILQSIFLGGETLRSKSTTLSDIFDPYRVYDKNYRIVPFE